MNAGPSFTPLVWICLGAVLFYVVMGVTSWRRRLLPGARPFALVCLFFALWTLGEALELLATGLPAKWFWFRFQNLWPLPALTAGVFFVLQYAGLGRWLTRRVVVLLCIPPLLVALLLLTNEAHQLFYLSPSYVADGRAAFGPGAAIFMAYVYLLALVNLPVLAWLAARSPADRLPVLLIVVGHLLVRIALAADLAGRNPFAPLDAVVVSLILLAVAYALALFRFRIFDPVRLARRLAIEQMGEGMVVIDPSGHVADVNPMAAAILGLPAAAARGQPAADLFPADFAPLVAGAGDTAVGDFSLGDDAQRRYYVAQAWPLRDRHHGPLGRLLLLSDVTEQKRAEQRHLAQQRALATLLERERLANELHDGVGQTLAYVSLQAETTRKQLSDGQLATADAQLARLAEAARDAHLDLRESILSLKTGPSAEHTFIEALESYLAGYSELYGIRAALTVAGGLEGAFAPETGVQLMRVIQEALANAHRHGGARAVCVALAGRDGQARLTISDDGRGFDPAALPDGGHYGLAIMRQRVAQIGGRLTIDSQPGAGTRIVVDAPLMPQPEAQP